MRMNQQRERREREREAQQQQPLAATISQQPSHDPQHNAGPSRTTPPVSSSALESTESLVVDDSEDARPGTPESIEAGIQPRRRRYAIAQSDLASTSSDKSQIDPHANEGQPATDGSEAEENFDLADIQHEHRGGGINDGDESRSTIRQPQQTLMSVTKGQTHPQGEEMESFIAALEGTAIDDGASDEDTGSISASDIKKSANNAINHPAANDTATNKTATNNTATNNTTASNNTASNNTASNSTASHRSGSSNITSEDNAYHITAFESAAAGGTPNNPNEWQVCSRCRARGVVRCEPCNGEGMRQCARCGGEGVRMNPLNEAGDDECPRCGGAGAHDCGYCEATGEVDCPRWIVRGA